jgi:hypothetical protein
MIVHEHNGKTYQWEQTHSGPIPVDADLMPLKHVPRGFHDAYQDWYWGRHRIAGNILSRVLLGAVRRNRKSDTVARQNIYIRVAWMALEKDMTLEVVDV